MITVGVDVADVERRLGEGRLRCPWCGGRLRRWGHAREREVRDLGGGLLRIRPRRARCGEGSCGRTQVLLPSRCWSRRADSVEVIGAAFTARAEGVGHRRIAEELDRPPGTVRGWLRRLGGRLESVRSFFTGLVVRVAIEPVLPEPAGSAWGDAVAAVAAAAGAVEQRFEALGQQGQGLVEGVEEGVVMGTVRCWQAAAAATDGGLLTPGWGPAATRWGRNTSSP